MPDISILREFLIVLAVTLSIVFFFQKLGIPSIVGFLLAGVVIGPDGFKLVRDIQVIGVIANIGVVILLFTIGLELSLAQIASVRRYAIWAGLLQVFLTALAVIALGFYFEISPLEGLFYGLLVSNSSTAIILKILSERGESDALHGRISTVMLVVQDLSFVPMVLLVPVIGATAAFSLAAIGWTIAQAVFAVVLIVVAARYILPWVLHRLARLRSREMFILFLVFISLGTAWLTSEFGLSLALGAFIAGLLISESEYSYQIVSDLLPLRDCFSGVFFISIGMLLDLNFVISNLPTLFGALAVLFLVKAGVILGIFWVLYRSLRLGLMVGLAFAQMGEFNFVLAQSGREHGLLSATAEQIFLATSILSMIIIPLLIHRGFRFSFRLTRMVGERAENAFTEAGDVSPAEHHVIIVGYGFNGQNLARVLKEIGIPYRILDLDPDLVRQARNEGEPIFFGDGTRPEVLRKMGIGKARTMTVAISDPMATARIVSLARGLRPELHIIVRTRYVAEIEHLYQLGANQVIPEEFETSVEIFARVLQEYHIPRNVISLQVDLIRKEHYGTLRGIHLEGKRLDELSQFLAGTTTDTFLIQEGSPAICKSLEELQLRSRAEVTVIAVVREGKSIPNPGPDLLLSAGDVLVLLGSHQALDQATQILSPARSSGEQVGGGHY